MHFVYVNLQGAGSSEIGDIAVKIFASELRTPFCNSFYVDLWKKNFVQSNTIYLNNKF